MHSINIKVMESSHDYNNHSVKISRNGEILFSEYLMKFNNSPLDIKLHQITSNKETTSIPSLDVYGYKGTLPNLDILVELQEWKDNE